MDPFDLHSAAPTVLAERERHLSDLAFEVVDTNALTDAAFEPAVATWEGIAAAELRAAPEPARDRAYRVASDLTWAATATRAWIGHVQAFNTKVEACRVARALVPTEVERYLASTPWTSLPILDADMIRERKRGELIKDLRRRWSEAYEEHIENGSRAVAGLLNRGPTWENLEYARRLGAFLAASPLLRFFTAGWEATAAPAAALRLAGLLRDPAHRQPDAVIEQLHSLLSRFADDEAFWFQFLTGLGPDGLLTLNGALALQVPNPRSSQDADPGPAGMTGGIQAMFGAGLALAATRRGDSTVYGGAAPAGNELPPEWLIALTEAGRQSYEIVAMRSGHPFVVEVYGYQLLGPMLHAGAYDEHFLQLVGGDLVDFEMGQGGARLWSGWPRGLGLSAGSMRLDWTGGSDAIRPHGFDPILGLVSAMDRNPEGALDLLAGRAQTGAGSWSDGDPKNVSLPPGGHRLPRLDYLLTDRDWPPAWANHHQSFGYLDRNPGAQYASPGVSQFGEVLERVARLDDPRAVTVTELIVYEINTDEQAMGYSNGAVPGEAWTQTANNVEKDIINPVLRHSLATIVSDYIIDVNAAVRDSGSSMPGGLGAEFDPTHMLRFLADLGKDQSAHDTLLGAQTAYAATAYHYYLSGEANLQPDSLHDRLVAAEGVARSYGAVSGALDVGAATADWYARWQADLARNTQVTDGFTVAEIVVGSAADLASVKAPGVSYAAGELTREVLGDFRELLMVDHSGLSTYRNAELFGDSRQVAATLAEAALYHSGQLNGLDDYDLLDSAGRPKPMSDWDRPDRDNWEDYKDRAGSATAGELPDRAGAAYQDGIDRAQLLMHSVLPDGEARSPR